MARINGPIKVWNRNDTAPTDAEGGYAGGDSTAAAIAGVVTTAEEKAKGAVREAFPTGKNLVNTDNAATYGPQSSWRPGTSVTPNTSETYAAYTATKPFPANSGTTYTGTRISNATFFDSSGARLTEWYVSNANHANPVTFTVPAGAVRMAVSYPTDFAAAVQVEEGEVATSHEAYRLRVPGLSADDGSPLISFVEGYRHPRGATEEAGDATYNGAFYGYGLSTLVPNKTRFNQVTVSFASTQASPVRVRVYQLDSMTAGALVVAGNGTSSVLLADVTLTDGFSVGTSPRETSVPLGEDVTVKAGAYVVVLITSTAASRITVAKWQTNDPGDRVGLWLATGADAVASSPGSLPANGSTPPRLDYITPAVAAITDQVDAALAPFPVHDYIDLWTSPVFDDGRNVYVPGQPVGMTTAAAPAAKGDTTLTIAAGYGAVPGSSFVTVPTEPTGQTLRVASVSGDVLTLAAPLKHPIANGQRLDRLWQNASHLSQSSNAALPGYAALARHIFESLAAQIPNPGAKITLLGNSWPVQGANSFAAQAAVTYPGATFVNAGVGGNTTAALLARFDTDVPADSDVVLLFEHVNDSYQGVDAATQAANWRSLVEKVHALGAWPVIIGPPPLNEYPTRALAQENATTSRAGTSVRVLQLERRIADLEA